MKGRTLSAIGAVAAVLAAVLLIFHNNINVSDVTVGCGALLILAGLANQIFSGRHSAGGTLHSFTDWCTIVAGVCMFIFKGELEPVITFVLGLGFGLCSVWQVYVLAIGVRPHQLPAWLFLFPAALAVGTVYIFICRHSGDVPHLMLGVGVELAITAVGCLIEGSTLGMANSKDEKLREQSADEASSADGSSPAAPQKVETTEDLDDEIIDHNEADK